jgi:ubiquinone/menaquinone biosynthesis C-methylase UbiE
MTNWGLSHLSIGQQDTILHIGCGGGGAVHQLAKIATRGQVYGIDFSDESVRGSRMTNKQFVQMGRVDIQQGSVSCLPFSDNMFDLVTAKVTMLPFSLNFNEGGKHDKRNHRYTD